MRINSPDYRYWKVRQNKKALLLRTRKKRAKRNARTNKIKYNYDLKRVAEYNFNTRKFEFHAPLNFSLIDNPKETISFFNNILSFITDQRNFGKNIFIDISQINHLTIDALTYLLAIVNNLNGNFNNRYSFFGNVPTNPRVRKLFSESGFYHFVRRRGTEPLTKSNDNVQIMSGENCDTKLAKRLSDFVSEKASISRRKCSFLYNIVIELMSNTHKHAYPKGESVLYSRWYCFAEYDASSKFSFSFMDTGSGIPSTVKKNFAEKIDFLKIKKEHEYVVSALNGDFRTSTGIGYRGKGLPKIRKFCTERKIQNLHILTNKADVRVMEENYLSSEIITPLQGTLYYWQIDLTELKKEAEYVNNY